MAANVTNDAKETLRLLFVNMHTIKAARTYALTDITTAAHECEQFYAEVQEGKADWDGPKVNAFIDEVEAYLDEYNNVNRNKLKREEENNVAKISLETVHDHILELQELPKKVSKTSTYRSSNTSNEPFMKCISPILKTSLAKLLPKYLRWQKT